MRILQVTSLTLCLTCSGASVAQNFQKRVAPAHCKDVLSTIFECTTQQRDKILVCTEGNRIEYRFIRRDNVDDVVVNIPKNQLNTFPLNNNVESIGFPTAEKEYRVFAIYNNSNDPNNIFDDNIRGGMRVLQDTKQVASAVCQNSPDSISIADVISEQPQIQIEDPIFNLVKVQQQEEDVINTIITNRNLVRPARDGIKNRPTISPVVKTENCIDSSKKILPRYVSNMENLIEFLND